MVMKRLVAVASNSCLTIRWLERGVGKVLQSFFLVEVSPPNKQSTIFVSCFDNNVCGLTKIF